MFLRRLRTKLPRVLSSLPRYACAVGEDAAVRPIPWANSTPATQCIVPRHPTSTSVVCEQQGSVPVLFNQPSAIATSSFHLEDEFRDNILTLPDDIELVRKLNPALGDAMEAHAELQRQSPTTLQEHVDALLRETHGKPVNLTKTALNRLRVDQLRGALDMVGEDLRGTKAVLVSRLRDALKSASAAAKVVDTAASLGEGVVSRKDLHRAARLAAGLPRPTGEAELRQAQEAALETAAAFSSVFRSPHDVARVLIDAHGEDIAIMDVRGRCSFTDHMVVASARSTQHARAMAAAVLHEVKTRCKEVAPGVAPVIEGAEDPDQHWLVVDAGSVVVHVFQEDVRKEYDLEGLWGEGTEIARVAPLQKKYTLNSITA